MNSIFDFLFLRATRGLIIAVCAGKRVYAERRIVERFAVNLQSEFLLVAKLTFAASHEKLVFYGIQESKFLSSFFAFYMH